MESILGEIYFNNHKIDRKISNDKSYKDLLQTTLDTYACVEALLKEKERELLMELSDQYAQLEAQAAFINYREGIRMGFRLAMELTEQDET